jgi:predicted nucleic acid-binding protein
MKGYFWDTNILTLFGYNPNHAVLRQHIERVSWHKIFLPSVVLAEVWRGRLRKADAVSKTESGQAVAPHKNLARTHEILSRFKIIAFDEGAVKKLSDLQQMKKYRKKQHADMMIAAMALSNQFILVTRNKKDFIGFLPPQQLENWADHPPV